MRLRPRSDAYYTCTECGQTVREAYTLVLGDQPLTLCEPCLVRLYRLAERQLRKHADDPFHQPN